MASTRSTARARRTALPPKARTPRQALVALFRHGARVQIAACTTTASTVLAWAEAADRFAQAVGDQLAQRLDGETDSAKLVASLTGAAGAHLRELTTLPRTAADHFDARLARASVDTQEVR
jgi:hypothetical protein